MCSVRLLIRDVRIAIWTSGDPESDSARRYCWINSVFRSLVTVIAAGESSTPAADYFAAQAWRRISLRCFNFWDDSNKHLTLTTSRPMYQCPEGLQGRVLVGVGCGSALTVLRVVHFRKRRLPGVSVLQALSQQS